MSGYTPVFRSVFTGSLCGQWPDTAAWISLLALADKNGEVDMTPQYISSVTGMPLGDLLLCISRFLDPDPMSRTAAKEGRRLELIDPSRTWGWRIINFTVYREKARLAAKSARDVAKGKEAERKRLERACPPVSAAVHPSYSDSNSNLLKKATGVAGRREEAKSVWPTVLAAIRNSDLRKSFPDGEDIQRAVREIGGWQNLGLKNSNLVGQTEQAFLNAYAAL